MTYNHIGFDVVLQVNVYRLPVGGLNCIFPCLWDGTHFFIKLWKCGSSVQCIYMNVKVKPKRHAINYILGAYSLQAHICMFFVSYVL